jgi:hypothetical protein
MAKLYNESRYQSFIATNDLTGKAGYAVALDGSNDGQVVLANAQTNKAIGILLVEGVAGQRVTVLLSNGQGTAAAVYGGNVSIGDALTPDTTGKLITTTTAADQVIARAKHAGASGETHEVFLEKCYYHA